MNHIRSIIRYALFGRLDPGEPKDGLGQGLLEDLRWHHRFRALRRVTLVWRRASIDEQREHDAHPILGRFGDMTHAIAEHDGRRLIARERTWHGWPDPPRFAILAFAPDGTIQLARDVDHWPDKWIFADP